MTRLADYRHSNRHQKLLTSLVPVVCPPEADSLGVTAAVVDHTELTMRAFPDMIRHALVLGMTTYDMSTVVWPRSLGRRAHQLPPPLAARWFESWWGSRLLPQRELAKAMKSMLCLSYFEMPEVLDRLGYTPAAWIDTVAKRRRESYQSDIDSHRRSLLSRDPLPGTDDDLISLDAHRVRKAGQ